MNVTELISELGQVPDPDNTLVVISASEIEEPCEFVALDEFVAEARTWHEPDLTEAQAARIAEYRKTFKFSRQPYIHPDGTVTFAYIASNNAGMTVHINATVQPDGTIRHTSL